jgi:hypothetical protein
MCFRHRSSAGGAGTPRRPRDRDDAERWPSEHLYLKREGADAFATGHRMVYRALSARCHDRARVRHLTSSLPLCPSTAASLLVGFPNLQEACLELVNAPEQGDSPWRLPYVGGTGLRRLVLSGPFVGVPHLGLPVLDLAGLSEAQHESSGSSGGASPRRGPKRRRLSPQQQAGAPAAEAASPAATSGASTGSSSDASTVAAAAAAAAADRREPLLSTAESGGAISLSHLSLSNLRVLNPGALGALTSLASLHLGAVQLQGAPRGPGSLWAAVLQALRPLTRLRRLELPDACCSAADWGSVLAQLPALQHLQLLQLQLPESSAASALASLRVQRLALLVQEPSLPGCLAWLLPALQRLDVTADGCAAALLAGLRGHPSVRLLKYHTLDGGTLELVAAEEQELQEQERVRRVTRMAQSAALLVLDPPRGSDMSAAGVAARQRAAQGAMRLLQACRCALAAAQAKLQRIQAAAAAGELCPVPPLSSLPALESVELQGVLGDACLQELASCTGLRVASLSMCGCRLPGTDVDVLQISPAGLLAVARGRAAASLAALRLRGFGVFLQLPDLVPLLQLVASGALAQLRELEVPLQWAPPGGRPSGEGRARMLGQLSEAELLVEQAELVKQLVQAGVAAEACEGSGRTGMALRVGGCRVLLSLREW